MSKLTALNTLIAAFEDACASLEMQAATAEQYAKTRDREPNLALAAELRRNVKYYRETIESYRVAAAIC